MLGGVFFTPPSLFIKELLLGVRGEEHLGQQQKLTRIPKLKVL
jgi:hypothetical protein